MAYIARDIKDRIANGDDCFYLEDMGGGKYRLVPAPDSIVEVGTSINRELLQPIEDRVVWLMNRIFDNITSNPFEIHFDTLEGISVTGIWNESSKRIEC